MSVRKIKVAQSSIPRYVGPFTHVIARAPLSKRDLTQLHKYREEQILTLDGVHADSLDFIADWTDLRDLKMYGCQFRDWSQMTKFKRLKYLFINTIRDREFDLSFLSQLRQLEDLGIAYMPHVTVFPDMSRCTRLKRLDISQCKRLNDLSSILRIPNLESFHIVSTPQEPTDLTAIMAMPKMKVMSGAFGSKQKDTLFHELLRKHGLVYGG